jgi:hypothetical protein
MRAAATSAEEINRNMENLPFVGFAQPIARWRHVQFNEAQQRADVVRNHHVSSIG